MGIFDRFQAGIDAFMGKREVQSDGFVFGKSGSEFADVLINRMSALETNRRYFEYYRMIRKLIPMADSAIDRVTKLTGDVYIESKNPKIIELASQFNDDFVINNYNLDGFQTVTTGYNLYVDSMIDNAIEFGVAVRELLYNERGEVIGAYNPPSTVLQFIQKMNNVYEAQYWDGKTWVKLEQDANVRLLYVKPNRGNPGGDSYLDGLGTYVEAYLRMIKSLQNIYFRFGDPSLLFTTTAESGGGKGNVASKAMAAIAANIEAVWAARAKGRTKDVFQDLGTSGVKLDVKVLGDNNARQILNISNDLKPIEEQLVAKFQLPSWMMGKNWSTTERLSNEEKKVLLNEAKARQGYVYTLIQNDFRMYLFSRGLGGYTYGKDWNIKWKDADFSDNKTQAEVNSMNATAFKNMVDGLIASYDTLGGSPEDFRQRILVNFDRFNETQE